MGVLADKDYKSMLESIRGYASEFVCVTPDSPRALSAPELKDTIIKNGDRAAACDSVFEGIEKAIELSGGKTPIVAFGSLYMAGAVRSGFKKIQEERIRS